MCYSPAVVKSTPQLSEKDLRKADVKINPTTSWVTFSVAKKKETQSTCLKSESEKRAKVFLACLGSQPK